MIEPPKTVRESLYKVLVRGIEDAEAVGSLDNDILLSLQHACYFATIGVGTEMCKSIGHAWETAKKQGSELPKEWLKRISHAYHNLGVPYQINYHVANGGYFADNEQVGEAVSSIVTANDLARRYGLEELLQKQLFIAFSEDLMR